MSAPLRTRCVAIGFPGGSEHSCGGSDGEFRTSLFALSGKDRRLDGR